MDAPETCQLGFLKKTKIVRFGAIDSKRTLPEMYPTGKEMAVNAPHCIMSEKLKF